MDFSKLSDQDLLALKAGDYSKLSTEGLLHLKAESGPQVQFPLDPEVINEEGVQPASILSDVTKGAGQGMRALGVMGTGSSRQDALAKLQEASQVAQGGEPTTPQGKFGAFIGNMASPAGIAMGAAASKGLQLAGEVLPGLGQTPIAKALTPGARSAVGKGIGEAEQAVGIEQKIATPSDLADQLGLKKGQRNFAGIVNNLHRKLKAGESITPQALKDVRELIAGEFREGRIPSGTTKEAIVSEVNKLAGDALNKTAQGRAALAKEYASIAKVQKIMKKLGLAAAGVATGAGAMKWLGK